MCFTVALVRNNKLIPANEYYNNLPITTKKTTSLPETPLYYCVSGFSHPKLPVIKEDGVFSYEWGLIPSWIKDLPSSIEIRNKTLNAKGETVFEKPSFRKCIVSQRCILPIVGYYEWRDVNSIKYPYFIEPKNQDFFLLGAIYDTWENMNSGEIQNTFSIITTPANALMEKIHNLKKRMPLILSEGESIKWLSSGLQKNEIMNLIKPYPDSLMSAYTISMIASGAQNIRNVPEITNPVEYNIEQ